MPLEAVHLSGLSDSLLLANSWVQKATSGNRLDAARVGALFVDLPYFDRFAWAALRFALAKPQARSPFGDLFHEQKPIALGRLFGEAGVRLLRSAQTRLAGETLIALALGYISHAAFDVTMHPRINRLARTMAARTGRQPSQEHHFIEVIQSLVFHRQRAGLALGQARLLRYVTVDARFLGRVGPVAHAVQTAIQGLHDRAPTLSQFGAFADGYLLYCALLGNSVLGPRLCRENTLAAARPELYDRFDFPALFSQAVQRSRAYLDALGNYLSDGIFDESARAMLAAHIPEGSIDPEPTARD